MSDEQPEDWVAALDQARRGLLDVAKVVADYRNALLAEGFTPEEAIMLTVSFQHQIIGAGT